jgi:transcriptional antiterminator NusG
MTDAARWYVLRVVAGFERKVKEVVMTAMAEDSPLGRAMTSAIEKVEVFSEERSTVRFGKKSIMEVSLVPGYVLLLMRYDPEVANAIRGKKHVMGFLGATGGGEPQWIEDADVQKMCDTATKKVREGLVEGFSIGDMVKINDGPFAGFSGRVDKVDKKGELSVAVDILGRKIPVALQSGQVERVGRDEQEG